VRTAAGWLCLASDAAHYYENCKRYGLTLCGEA
jgi:hypothetical protein